MRRALACLVACWLAAARAQPARCTAAACTRVGGGTGVSTSDHEYRVEGNKLILDFAASKLKVDCDGRPVLDSAALPAFERAVRASSATFARCPPPGRSLAAALRALNVTLAFAETLGNLSLESLPPRPTLAAGHFLGLERLVSLKLTADGGRPPPAPAPGFLAALSALRSLVVAGVRLAPAELESPPRALRVLSLRDAGVERLPEALLRLPQLSHVTLDEPRLATFTVPPTWRALSISSPDTTLRLDSILALETFSLDRWAEPKPPPWAHCGALRALLLTSPALEELPPRWVAECALLERLVLQYARHLRRLPARLLEGATALVQLTIRQGELEALPAGLLEHVPNLRVLDLKGNRLHTLPSGTFAGPRALAELNLASNLLTGEALHALTALRDLTVLSLANNSRIADDVCESGYSPILTLTRLTSLFLNKTNVTRICRDWRESMTVLGTLDLRDTNISELWYSDVQFSRTIPSAEVRLEGAPVRVLGFTADDYAAALRAPPSGAVVRLDSQLACDCRMYRTRLALEHAPGTLRVLGLRCRAENAELAPRALADTAPEDMYCEAENACRAAELPAACECWRRPSSRGGHVVRVDCARRNRSSVPPLRAQPATVYRLLLAGNNISELRAEDLGPHLQELDLRDNLIENVDEATATAIGWVGTLLLAGNPLECDCTAAPLLRALHGRARAATELKGATCTGGGPVAAAVAEPCRARLPLAAWLAASLAVLLAVTSATAAYLASRERRLFLKVLLHRWGVLRRSAEPDDARRFDAFVSFSHEDEEVVRVLVTRLEAGPAPYRLCLHYRDWVPGRWIPDQIQASVNQSRRTLALVSRHFLESEWARAEFREAHAHALRDVTPRLVVVLLEDPAALPLDSELRRYLSANTYVRWGDPWFWDKLALALPAPRPPADSRVSPNSCVFSVESQLPEDHLSDSQTIDSESPLESTSPHWTITDSPFAQKELVPPPLAREESAPPPLAQKESAPPPLAQKESAPPSLAQEESSPPPLAQEESTPPLLAQEESSPPPPAQEESAPPLLAQEESAPPPLAQEESAPPLLAQEESSPPPLAQEESAPPLLAQEESSPPPLAQEESVPPQIAREVIRYPSFTPHHAFSPSVAVAM